MVITPVASCVQAEEELSGKLATREFNKEAARIKIKTQIKGRLVTTSYFDCNAHYN